MYVYIYIHTYIYIHIYIFSKYSLKRVSNIKIKHNVSLKKSKPFENQKNSKMWTSGKLSGHRNQCVTISQTCKLRYSSKVMFLLHE